MKLLLASLLAVLTLSACGEAAAGDGSDKNVHGVTVQMPDGTSVQCAVYEGYKAGGLDCDWSND